jgi:ATP-dependent protease ClpP protease subunit
MKVLRACVVTAVVTTALSLGASIALVGDAGMSQGVCCYGR